MRRSRVIPCCLLAGCHALAQGVNAPQPDDSVQSPSVLATPVDFSGWQGESGDPKMLREIRIGIFAPPDPEGRVSGPMLAGATLAVEQINAAGGFEGTPLVLITRWDDDPWRGGSKQMVRLVYEDSVWAVIGSIDGATTHIAEQVVTKTWAPLISPVSADPTLTFIRIPWIFRLPPDDRQQSLTLVRDGIVTLSLDEVGLITSTEHDGRTFASEIQATMEEYGVTPAFHFEVQPDDADYTAVARRAASFSPDGIVVRLSPDGTLDLLDRMQRTGFRGSMLLPWIPGLQQSELLGRYGGRVLLVRPFTTAGNPAWEGFSDSFRERYGKFPTPSAAFTYDAVRMLALAMGESGLNRSGLRDALATNSGYLGATGSISWDNAGGNVAEPSLVSIGKRSN